MENGRSIPPAGKWPRLFWPRWVALAIAVAVGLGGGWLTGRESPNGTAAAALAAMTYGAFMAFAAAGRDTLEHIHPVFGGWTSSLAAVVTIAVGAAVGMPSGWPLPVALAAAVGAVFTARDDRSGRLFDLNRPRERALHERRFAAEAVTRRAVVTEMGKTLAEIDHRGRTSVSLTLRYTDGADGESVVRTQYEFPVHLPPRVGAKATVRYLRDNPGDRRIELDPPEAPEPSDAVPQDAPPRG
ncbi:hypothetical protein ACFV1L_11275 [Kitasatospora sp. NPDC059646]|uniref:hypothetical protein n=1 Tax=Kitasatospora sp. NPDC059646 TaxID=3346893 RepID=UPI0036809395